MFNHLINDCSKRVQKENKIRHDWVGKVIYLESCKRLKFDQTNKWYVHKPECVRGNEKYKILWDFEIQTIKIISARRPDLLLINKK